MSKLEKYKRGMWWAPVPNVSTALWTTAMWINYITNRGHFTDGPESNMG